MRENFSSWLLLQLLLLFHPCKKFSVLISRRLFPELRQAVLKLTIRLHLFSRIGNGRAASCIPDTLADLLSLLLLIFLILTPVLISVLL